ncbi:MAG: 4-(cytidine 5'-diphospho)-2-C-methyl-D-erythritol kinase [Pseudolabrys sp.]|nr:4-(cytidine 5'-diphospho)-2-C-methyl-D-erythritol kinase [Pseudolabrys sp.]
MSTALVDIAPAKINLTLRVLGRRADGYHDLESLVAFADVADRLTLVPGAKLGLEVIGPFADAAGPIQDNLVIKAVAALRERKGGLKAGHFTLEKNIPVAGGVGGGSADAAAALRLLARANNMAAGDPRLASAGLRVGADVPVCLDCRVRLMRGVGDLLSEPIDLPHLPAVLANPGKPLATRDVFAKFNGISGKRRIDTIPPMVDALIDFLKLHDNDLEPAAVVCEPAVGDVMMALRALPGTRLVRMSGSGPTCFALFGSSAEAASAARRLQTENKGWWVRAASFGSVALNP